MANEANTPDLSDLTPIEGTERPIAAPVAPASHSSTPDLSDLTPVDGTERLIATPKAAPLTPDQYGSSMSATTPSLWERIKHAVTQGIPTFNSDFEVASHTDTGQLASGETPKMQLITPEAAMTAAEKKAHPVVTGVAEAAGSLTSPESAAVIAGTAGLGELSAAGKTILPRLVSAGFSAQALKGAYDQIPEFKKALDSGDTHEAERILTHMVLDTGMALLAGRHAATGGPAISGTAEDAVAGGKRIASGVSSGARKVAEAPGKIADAAKNTAEAIKPEWLTKRPESPAPQHGTPVKVESPLDSPTISKQAGGKDLSKQAIETLQGHVGDKIEIGKTAKTKLMEAIQPVTETISETAKQVNAKVKDAPQFITSVATDAGFSENSLTSDIEKIKSDLPPSVRKGLSEDVDAVMQDADKALKSTDPLEVLEQRRLLGNRIDWENVVKNPTTPAEAQNLARIKVYRALGDKIHSEIPETVELDKKLQPNLELRSHLQNRLGERAIDDPHAATAEAQQQTKLGKAKIESDIHNEQVGKNWSRVKAALITAGIGSGVIHEISRLFGE